MEDRAEHKASQYLLFIIQYNTIPGRTDHLHSAGTPAAVSCICSVITELLLIIVENIRLFGFTGQCNAKTYGAMAASQKGLILVSVRQTSAEHA